MSSSISSFFSSLVGTLHADAPEEAKIPDPEPQEEVAGEAAEEEEDPEDIHPQLREEAQESPKCKAATQHFLHCQEKVQSGKGFKHEDCVEEMFHMMHCTDNELAPKLFAKLR
ncbi:ubiquinol-cytochrome C reductase hinge domain-containing protein [Russula brevipes]|nr:ubiquinol-cytochrome C reductase hinge domain-containing protein [Russula brevipes]